MDQVEIGILRGKLMDPIRVDESCQTIATNNFGAFVAIRFKLPKESSGEELEINGGARANPPTADVFGRVLSRKVKLRKLLSSQSHACPPKSASLPG